MIHSKETNPLDSFVAHGVKTIGAFQYVLMIDEDGQTVIERVADDTTTIMFTLMPTPTSKHFNDIATAIDAFWSAPEVHQYTYMFQC